MHILLNPLELKKKFEEDSIQWRHSQAKGNVAVSTIRGAARERERNS